MNIKKILCLATSFLMFGGCFAPASAMPRNRRRRRQTHLSAKQGWGASVSYSQRKRAHEDFAEVAAPDTPRIPPVPSGASAAGVSVAAKTEQTPADSSEKPMAEKAEESGAASPSESDDKMCDTEEEQKTQETTKSTGGKVWAVNSLFKCAGTLIGPDDIGPDFPEKVPRHSIYYEIAVKLREYYQLWRMIERNLMILKQTLPKEKHAALYRKWWDDSVVKHASVFLRFPNYIKQAYSRAISYPDVRLGQEDCQVKIIEHMQKEWSIESKLFAMAVLTSDDTYAWQDVRTALDSAIAMEKKYWNEDLLPVLKSF